MEQLSKSARTGAILPGVLLEEVHWHGNVHKGGEYRP